MGKTMAKITPWVTRAVSSMISRCPRGRSRQAKVDLVVPFDSGWRVDHTVRCHSLSKFRWHHIHLKWGMAVDHNLTCPLDNSLAHAYK